MKTFSSRRALLFLELAGISLWWLSRASADTFFFSNYNIPFLNPTEGAGLLSAVSHRFATEFFTLANPATVRGAALAIWNTDTVEHDLDAWLYAADGPNNGPGTLLTAFTSGDDLISAGETDLATFSHAGFTLNPNTQYWLVAGVAEPVVQSPVHWLATSSNNADFSGMFTVSSTPTTFLQMSTDGGATFATASGLNGKFGLADFAAAVNRVWDSGGASDLWSDGANWSSNTAPVNGDSLTFGSGAWTNPVMDYPLLSVNAVAFTATAPAFTIHVPESGSSRQLTITGALTNASAFEQTLIADGATGPGNSGVLTIASNTMSGPFALIARGPTGAGPNGGVIEFSGVADGVETRVVTEPGTYFDFSGRLGMLRLGSIEGGGLVLMGFNSLAVGWNNLDTEFSGTLAGGPTAGLEKYGTGRLILSESNTYGGFTFVSGGILEVRAPANGLGPGNAAIQGGSELVFSQAAVGGFQTINAQPASVVGQNGGLLRFTDSASAGRLTMVVEGAAAGFNAGRIIFEESSNAGTSTSIEVQPANGANGSPGVVTFTGNATATGATITNGGLTDFLESATAGSATIINRAAAVNFGRPGETTFQADSTAGRATIINEAGSGANRFGGKTFIGSDAGTATITAMGGGFPGGQGQVRMALS